MEMTPSPRADRASPAHILVLLGFARVRPSLLRSGGCALKGLPVSVGPGLHPVELLDGVVKFPAALSIDRRIHGSGHGRFVRRERVFWLGLDLTAQALDLVLQLLRGSEGLGRLRRDLWTGIMGSGLELRLEGRGGSELGLSLVRALFIMGAIGIDEGTVFGAECGPLAGELRDPVVRDARVLARIGGRGLGCGGRR